MARLPQIRRKEIGVVEIGMVLKWFDANAAVP